MGTMTWFLLAVMLAASVAGGFVDASTWWIRCFSDGTQMGQYVARTNIYNYFGRTFAFVYLACLSLLVDTGQTTQYVALFVGLSFVVGAVSQPMLLNRSRPSQMLLMFIARLIRLEPHPLPEHGGPIPQGNRLFLFTGVAYFLLAMAGSLPYIVASVFPQYRLTISSTTQILNSFGTILVLTFVEQILYGMWDKSNLSSSLPYYMRGKVLGGLVAGLLLIVLFVFVKVHGI